LASLLNGVPECLRYNDHQIGHGPAFHRLACQHGVEGIVSKRTNGRYEPDRRTWLKIKCLNREEFVVVGFSDPEGCRHRIGALLLGSTPRRASSFMQAGLAPVCQEPSWSVSDGCWTHRAGRADLPVTPFVAGFGTVDFYHGEPLS
jgi:hypothetical protein